MKKIPEGGSLEKEDLVLLPVLQQGYTVEPAPFPGTHGDLEHTGGESVT